VRSIIKLHSWREQVNEKKNNMHTYFSKKLTHGWEEEIYFVNLECTLTYHFVTRLMFIVYIYIHIHQRCYQGCLTNKTWRTFWCMKLLRHTRVPCVVPNHLLSYLGTGTLINVPQLNWTMTDTIQCPKEEWINKHWITCSFYDWMKL
jgi:hypothetical protein